MFPIDFRVCVHGVFKRMKVFVDALKQIAQLDMLFYVGPEVDVRPGSIESFQSSLSRYWETSIRLQLCPRNELDLGAPRWDRYGKGIFDFFEQAAYKFTSGPRQVMACQSALKRSPDIIFAHKLSSMCPLLLTGGALPTIMFDLDDIEHVARLRRARHLRDFRARVLSYSYVPMLRKGERQAVRVAHRTFVCSETDRTYLSKKWSLPGIVTVPNTIPDEIMKQPPQLSAGQPNYLFVGSYLYDPNVQAARWFLEKIWPRIREAVPMAHLVLAGGSPERVGNCANGPGVETAGFVDDLESLYRRSRVVVVPILSGGGTRIKIIEAGALGKPIVSTRVGAEGLEMRDGFELLIRDDAESFSRACIDLARDTGLCEQLGRAAYEAVWPRYDRERVMRTIRGHFLRATAEKRMQARFKIETPAPPDGLVGTTP